MMRERVQRESGNIDLLYYIIREHDDSGNIDVLYYYSLRESDHSGNIGLLYFNDY